MTFCVRSSSLGYSLHKCEAHGFVRVEACSARRLWPLNSEPKLAINRVSEYLSQRRCLSINTPFIFGLQGLRPLNRGFTSADRRQIWSCHLQPKCYGLQAPVEEDFALLAKNLSEYHLLGRGFEGGEKWESDDCLDVAVLGNLCLDIVLNVPSLPPREQHEKYKYMQQLAASIPDERSWEAGGNSNFAITASRLGLRTTIIGHVGNDKFGHFLLEVLGREGIAMVDFGDQNAAFRGNDYDGSTLLCWVLVDPKQNHSFCSGFDFMKDPVFSQIVKLTPRVEAAIKKSKALFCNGFVFDELLPATIQLAVDCAQASGSALFFDPGPKGRSIAKGTVEQKAALEKLLRFSDVLLLTADEAEAFTAEFDPLLSSRMLLRRYQSMKWVIVKLGEKGCLLATSKRYYQISGFKVDVIDTVGCGDSFAAAIVLGYLREVPAITAITLANAVGAATAQGSGAGRNVATRSKVSDILSCKKEKIHDINFHNVLKKLDGNTESITFVGKVNDVRQKVAMVAIETAAKAALNLLESTEARTSQC